MFDKVVVVIARFGVVLNNFFLLPCMPNEKKKWVHRDEVSIRRVTTIHAQYILLFFASEKQQQQQDSPFFPSSPVIFRSKGQNAK